MKTNTTTKNSRNSKKVRIITTNPETKNFRTPQLISLEDQLREAKETGQLPDNQGALAPLITSSPEKSGEKEDSMAAKAAAEAASKNPPQRRVSDKPKKEVKEKYSRVEALMEAFQTLAKRDKGIFTVDQKAAIELSHRLYIQHGGTDKPVEAAFFYRVGTALVKKLGLLKEINTISSKDKYGFQIDSKTSKAAAMASEGKYTAEEIKKECGDSVLSGTLAAIAKKGYKVTKNDKGIYSISASPTS